MYHLTLESDLVAYVDFLKFNDYDGDRSKSKTELLDNKLKIEIKANDATALRASFDGYVKALKIIETTQRIIRENESIKSAD